MSDSTLAERLHRIAMEVAVGRPRAEAIAELTADGGLTEAGAEEMLAHALGEISDEQLWPVPPGESWEPAMPEALRYFESAIEARRGRIARLRPLPRPGTGPNDDASTEDGA